MHKKTVTIDAEGKRLGRLATTIAHVLNGKDSSNYAPNKVPDVRVTVSNTSKMQISDAKKKGKIYTRYTGYFGGLRKLSLEELIQKKGYSEALRRAVFGMLPGNRIRKLKIKNLYITE